MNIQSLLPTGYSWREYWDFKNTSSASVHRKLRDGDYLDFKNSAAVRTTVDGIHFGGGATSNMVTTADAVLNAQDKIFFSVRFRLTRDFATGSASQYLLTKRLAADDYLDMWLETTDGKLYFRQGDRAAGIQFTLTSTTESWTGGAWYTATCSLSDTGPAQRMIVNGAVEDTDTVAALATSNGGDLVLGNSTDGGTDGFVGTISWLVVGTDNLTTTADTGEEALLGKGFAPSDAVNFYLLDEGMNSTAYDRGSGADDATLDSTCIWDFGRTKLTCLSIEGIDDYVDNSNESVNLTWPMSFIWVGKMKSTYSTLGASHDFMYMRADANNDILLYYLTGSNDIEIQFKGSSSAGTLQYATVPSIDDYLIIIGTCNGSGECAMYVNGSQVDTDTGVGDMLAAGAHISLGASTVPDVYDVSKCILAGVIGGPLTDKDAKILSRRIDQRFNLGLSI